MARPVQAMLAASLLLNVFAVGALGGGLVTVLRHEGAGVQGGMRAGLMHRPIQAAGQGLPAPDRQRFRHTMIEILRDSRDLQQAARADREEAARLFVQPQFDAAAVAAALGQARAADLQLRVRLETAAIDFAAMLPEDERAILAQNLARGGPLRHPARTVAVPDNRR